MEWSTLGLVNSQTGQLVDATGSSSFGCKRVITLICGDKTPPVTTRSRSNKHVRLVLCYVILCQHYRVIKSTTTTASDICELSSLRLVHPRVD